MVLNFSVYTLEEERDYSSTIKQEQIQADTKTLHLH